MNICICCHNKLLRHLSHNRVSWFCPNCHQEMPNLDILLLQNQQKLQKNNQIKKFNLALKTQ